MVCPLLFPTLYGEFDLLSDKMKTLEKRSIENLEEIEKKAGMNLHQSYNEMEFGIFPVKDQKFNAKKAYAKKVDKEFQKRVAKAFEDNPEAAELAGQTWDKDWKTSSEP